MPTELTPCVIPGCPYQGVPGNIPCFCPNEPCQHENIALCAPHSGDLYGILDNYEGDLTLDRANIAIAEFLVRNQHRARVATYMELQELPDGHQAVWIDTQDQQRYCFYLPLTQEFAGFEIVPGERPLCMELHCKARDHEHLIGSADCSYQEAIGGGLEAK